MSIKQALISVSDKIGIVEFARELSRLGVAILSTGGTAKLLKDAGLAVTEVSDYTGFPEMLDGRVKTLHPKIHAGILARQDLPEHMATMEKAAIPTIDLVVVNLYPFTQTVARPDCTFEEAIENIDIGGPAMVRAAAKNYKSVTVVTDPADYAPLLREIKSSGGTVSPELRFRLACKAFSHTASYDSAISNYLTSMEGEGGERRVFPQRLNLNFKIAQDLRYGENPHQQAAFYREPVARAGQPCQLCSTPGQGTVVQQYRRCGCRVGMRQDLRAAGLRHHQACQSLRRGDWPIPRSAHTSAPLPLIPPPPSAASSLSTACWTARQPRR